MEFLICRKEIVDKKGGTGTKRAWREEVAVLSGTVQARAWCLCRKLGW